MSRDDLVATNEKIVKDVTEKVIAQSPNAILIVVSNPLDAMCHVAKNVSGWPKERVFGMAGILDTARFSTFIAWETGASLKDVRAMVLGGHGDQMVSIEADFGEADAPARVVAAAREALGPLDVLVVNHARSGLGRLDELTAEHLDAFLHENVRASLLLVKEFAAQFEGDSGRVVLITSGAHLDAMTGEVAYAVSKGALAIATRTLAKELAER